MAGGNNSMARYFCLFSIHTHNTQNSVEIYSYKITPSYLCGMYVMWSIVCID